MSQNTKLYSLELLFDKNQITLEDLQKEINNTLQQYLQEDNLDIAISQTSNGILFKLQGILEIVDACQQSIDEKLIKSNNFKCIRLWDEAGDEIRKQAYPILSEIEQSFRRFINQALIKVSGFDWWDDLAPNNIHLKVQDIRKKHNDKSMFLDNLECTQFEDLINIITTEKSTIPEDKILNMNDFKEFISDCNSIEDIKNKIEKKTKKISLWDSFFIQYFEDRDEWEEMKKTITGFIINKRHKVMHHRPMKLNVIKALLKKKEEIIALLNSAKSELSQEELVEAQKDIRTIKEAILAQDQEIDDRVQRINRGISKEITQVSDLLKEFTQTSEFFRKKESDLLKGFNQTSEFFKERESGLLQAFAQSVESLSLGLPKESELLKGFTKTSEILMKKESDLLKGFTQTSEILKKRESELLKGLTQSIESLSLGLPKESELLKGFTQTSELLTKKESALLNQINQNNELLRKRESVLLNQINQINKSLRISQKSGLF